VQANADAADAAARDKQQADADAMQQTTGDLIAAAQAAAADAEARANEAEQAMTTDEMAKQDAARAAADAQSQKVAAGVQRAADDAQWLDSEFQLRASEAEQRLDADQRVFDQGQTALAQARDSHRSALAAALDASRAARQAAGERALQRRQYLESLYSRARQAGTAAIRSH
jgi:hypothetical protein